MERLTERNPLWIDDELWERACEPDCEEIDAVYRKLKDYEDAEEQGLLLLLPCKVEDTIYEVSYENRKYIIREHVVNQFVYIAYRKPRIEIYCKGENGFLLSSITGQLDDGLFLTREEAEAKLKEMEDEHGEITDKVPKARGRKRVKEEPGAAVSTKREEEPRAVVDVPESVIAACQRELVYMQQGIDSKKETIGKMEENIKKLKGQIAEDEKQMKEITAFCRG